MKLLLELSREISALAALNAAPPPPGWVEPTRAEATGVCAKCYGTWMSSEHACPNCGRLAGKCLKCEGTGWWRNEPTADEGVKCPDCHGTGIRSFERPPPAPQPASEGVRWFFRKSDGLVWEGTSKGGRWLNSRGEFHQETRLYPEFFQKDADNYTELDGPPPHGKPLAKPATEGDGKPENAPADRTRLTLYPSQMCEATQAAFDWIKSHDGGAHGALFTRALSDACAEYAAHMTTSLRAEVEAQKKQRDAARSEAESRASHIDTLVKEREELRRRLSVFEKDLAEQSKFTPEPTPKQRGKGKGVRNGK